MEGVGRSMACCKALPGGCGRVETRKNRKSGPSMLAFWCFFHGPVYGIKGGAPLLSVVGSFNVLANRAIGKRCECGAVEPRTAVGVGQCAPEPSAEAIRADLKLPYAFLPL